MNPQNFKPALTHQRNVPSTKLPVPFTGAEGFQSKLYLHLAGKTTSGILPSLSCSGYSQVVGCFNLQ